MKGNNMEEDNMQTESSQPAKIKITTRHAAAGSVYGPAFLGTLFYYLSNATTFMEGLLGIFKAIFWPGTLMYEVLQHFHA